MLQASAVNAFEHCRFVAVVHHQHRGIGRYLVTPALQDLVPGGLVLTLQALLGDERAIAGLGACAFDFQAQFRAFFQRGCQLVQGRLGVATELAGPRGESYVAQVFRATAGNQPANELERRLCRTQYQVAQGLPDDRHHTELWVVEVARHWQLDRNLALGIFEQRHRKANRQVYGVWAVDFFTQLQLLHHHLVLGLELAVGNQVVQVEVEPAFANAKARELAGVGREGGQFDALEAGGDIQAGQRVERVECALDGDRCVAVDLALHVDLGRHRLAVVDGADLAIELLNGRGEVRGEGEVGEVGRAVVDVDLADVDTQRFVAAGCGRLDLAFRRGASRLRDQQVIDVGGAVFVDDEACIGLQQGYLVDRQGIAVYIRQAIDVHLLPFDEVAALDGVEGVQLVHLGLARDIEGQRCGVLQVDLEVAGEHATAQFQQDERADIGLCYAQVDIAGAYIQLGPYRRQVDLAGRLQLALLAYARIELEREGRLVEAVEALQVGVERADVQGYRFFLAAVCQVHQIVAQLHVLEQHLPRLARLFGGLLLRCRLGGSRLCLFLRRGFGRLAGKQLLPIELAVLFQRSPGFEFFAADFTYGDLLLDQVNGGFAHLQAGQARQGAAIRRLDGERRNANGGVFQQQLGLFGEVELVVRVEADHAVFQHQWHGITHVRPEGLHFAFRDLQRAFRGDR